MGKTPSTLRSSRPVQLLFVALLLTCLGQVAWWVVDQNQHAAEVQQLVHELLEHDADVARQLAAEDGINQARLIELFPDVDFLSDGSVDISSIRLDLLQNDRENRQRRFDWEAGFFVIVLLSTLGLIGVTLRTRTDLVLRQQNFLAAVSHELKSPLASIKLSAETLLLRTPEPEAAERIAKRMVQATDRLTVMVTNLLDTARLDDEQVELNQERLNLAVLVERNLEPLRSELKQHGVELTGSIPADLQILADPTAAQSVIANLVSNAVKSTQANGGGVVTVSAQCDSDKVVMHVQDNGMGFQPKLAEQLFERFFRPGNELVRRTKGSGLGLFIVRRFMQLDKGRVVAHSDGEGKGATFKVTWMAATEPGSLGS